MKGRKQYFEKKQYIAARITEHVLHKDEIDAQVKQHWGKTGQLAVRKRISKKDREYAKKVLTRQIAQKITKKSIDFHNQFSFRKQNFL